MLRSKSRVLHHSFDPIADVTEGQTSAIAKRAKLLMDVSESKDDSIKVITHDNFNLNLAEYRAMSMNEVKSKM